MCDQDFAEYDPFFKHIQTHPIDAILYDETADDFKIEDHVSCDDCGARFYHMLAYTYHISSQSQADESLLLCVHCHKLFERQSCFSCHLVLEHKGQCPYCEMTQYNDAKALSLHLGHCKKKNVW